MSRPNRVQERSLSAKLVPLLEEACDQFEAALKDGERPRIELVLESMPEPGRHALLHELLILELEYRCEDSNRPNLEEYLARFAGQEDAVRAAFLAVRSGDSTVDLHPPRGPAALPQSPEWIGRYRIERLAGQGGFGLVYVARDEQLNRPVAIKVAHARLVGRAEDVQAYLEEARIVASLDHPHIVPVYDVGGTKQFPCFVVSKFIDGESLATTIEQERPTSEQAAELVATVAEALHYAHTRGLVHRDVKPGNILIDASGRAFVTDFGLALKEEEFGERGGLAGTPAYMSPEQAKGEGHRVDGRSDIFSLGVVFYELLTGRRPFLSNAEGKDEALKELLDLIATTEPRPPRQIDDAIPKELERICLKAMSRRASDRFTTARDMAEDLRAFLKSARGTISPVAQVVAMSVPPGSTQEETPLPSPAKRPDSQQQPIKIVPKGLRSFDEHDADFFLELLPGPRDRHGLPESIRFWKSRIDTTDPDKGFKVGLIYGPSGCGKSSLVKAGLLPRLGNHILPVYVEATQEETENRLLRGLCKICPDVPTRLGLVDSLAAVRKGRILRSGHKVLVVLDQFEQWLHGKRGEENTELVNAVRQCDGEHIQSVVMVRDDFWMAATRFMRQLEIDLVPDRNIASVDLFDPQHTKKLLGAFGSAYGKLPERERDRTPEQQGFLSQAVSELTQDGKVVSVRLALFAEMVKGKPWTPLALREVGGTEGVGVTFLEETFGSSHSNPKYRLHQKAAQAVLKSLLPESGSDIKGQMRSEQDLQVRSGYADHPREFADLMHVLDSELRLITPTEPADSGEEQLAASSRGRYFQLTHDYLVRSLRDWLTRKQRQTWRGRAELRLAERSASWNLTPENRHLPSAIEWANIRLLTRRRNWTEAERGMMRRAGRIHGLRALGVAAGLMAALLIGLDIDHRYVLGNERTVAAGLVEQVVRAKIVQVPDIVKSMAKHRRWVDPPLHQAAERSPERGAERLHASLALLPVDDTQVDYLYRRLLDADADQLPVLREALKPHRASLSGRLWQVVEASQPDDPRLLPSASALAGYDPENTKWQSASGKLAQALVSLNSLLLGPWIEALRPVRGKLTMPLAEIFADESRSETVHSLATDILADYASQDPSRLAELLMVSDYTAFRRLFPVAEKKAEQVLPFFRAELDKRTKYSWDDPPLDKAWIEPEAALVKRIESAQGILMERFAFCQTMRMGEFLSSAGSLRKLGYRPLRFRPYADGQVVRVAAVWTRDGRNWQISSGLNRDEIRQQDEQNRKLSLIPVDVAGYIVTGAEGKVADRYAAVWVEKTVDDDARMYAGLTAEEETEGRADFEDANLVPRTLHTTIDADGRPRYCGTWGRPPGVAITGQSDQDQFQGNFDQKQAELSDQLLADVAINGRGKQQAIRERVRTDLARAEKKLKSEPDDPDARLARAMANFRLGENHKALDDFQLVIEKSPNKNSAKRCRVIGLARLGKKDDALTELARFSTEAETPEGAKVSLAAVVAAELGEGADKALNALEAAVKKQPENADLRYDAARAFSSASKAVSRSDKAKGRQLAERALRLLREAVKNDDADFGRMNEDGDLDPIRDDPAFAEIMKADHPDRRYAAVWSSDASFEAIAVYGLGPTAQLQRCRDLTSSGYRPVSWSVTRCAPEEPAVTASVWHRPVITETAKDRLAERQARAAISLLRMGKTAEVIPLLRYSPDPRLRSFIVNWLKPLEADPKTIAAELDRLPTTGPTPVPAIQRMDAVLFHRETSMRRALILAMGTYGTKGLSPDEREPLIGTLLDLYRNDPDAGIHGAAEWTVWKWGRRDLLNATDVQLMKLKDWGKRRWFVNGQRQTFAVIEGPVEFRMGSPPTETERYDWGEAPKRMAIPRRFAIAAKEVTVEQFQRFLKLVPHGDPYKTSANFLNKHSPDPQGPWIGPDWYTAAHYCNWLSDQEGLPKDQWYYLPNASGAYAEGMSIPAHGLERSGYRLPTEAEWEYACRAGAVTSRYFGHSIAVLDAYAQYQANSKEHAWMCGSPLPNDLGLFDMLGNVYEWCQDSALESMQLKKGRIEDVIVRRTYVTHWTPQRLRGGAFSIQPMFLRSAIRNGNTPSYRNDYVGFRLARTYPGITSSP
jgi:serine/threonine protein kinase/formylglycine-generating enzyme required for sulfatase activity/tetratricopeptide (TPR) repeat protein